MIKFFRKIRQKLLSENRFAKYIMYAAGEIVLVVVGILIALQLNIARENGKKEKLEIGYLKGILNDLDQDINDLHGLLDKDTAQFTAYTQMLRAFTDSSINVYALPFLKNLATAYGWHSFKGNSIVFQDLKSSGNVNLIKSDKLRFSILEYYNKSENIASYQNGLELDLITDYKRKSFEQYLDLNSMAEIYFRGHWKAEIDPLDLSFFDSDPASDEVKEFANSISLIKIQVNEGHMDNMDLLELATELQSNINTYLEGDEVDVLPVMSNEILVAIEAGNTEKLDELIADETLNECFRIPYSSYTYLIVAIRAGSFESAKYFIERGADLEAYCKNKTALMYCIQYKRQDIFDFLLNNDANPNFTIEGRNALDWAIGFEREEMQEILTDLSEN